MNIKSFREWKHDIVVEDSKKHNVQRYYRWSRDGFHQQYGCYVQKMRNQENNMKNEPNIERKEAANKALSYIIEYLEKVGWIMCSETLFMTDPITKVHYPSDTAFSIQIARDLMY